MDINFISSNPALDAYQKAAKDTREQDKSDLDNQLTRERIAEQPTRLRMMGAQADLATTQATTAQATAPYAVPEIKARLQQIQAGVAQTVQQTDASKVQEWLNVYEGQNKLAERGDFVGSKQLAAQAGIKGVPDDTLQNAQGRAQLQSVIETAKTQYPNQPKNQFVYISGQIARQHLEKVPGAAAYQAAPGQPEPPETSGVANFDVLNRQETDESGKPVVKTYRFDKKTGQMAPIEGSGALTKTTPGAVLGDDEATVRATRALKGDTSAYQNLGRGAQGSENIAKIDSMVVKAGKAQGLTNEQIGVQMALAKQEFAGGTQAQRTLGTQEARMGTAAFEAKGAINLARTAINKVPRTGLLAVNKLIEGFQNQTLNPDQAELYTRTQGVVNTYSAVMARGANVTTDASRHRAEELVQSAANPEVFNRVLDTMQSEMDMAINSPEQMRQFYRQKYGSGALSDAGGTGGGQPYTAAPGSGSPSGSIVPHGEQIIGGGTGQGAPRAPAVGTIEDGHRFLGGDPSNPQSWQAVQ